MLTLGIAGHVDHGKTSLVRALTGMETDRLPEEQRRGISIELGFAWLDVDLGDGRQERVALVDMPGHERFVRRMIAGAAGIDAVLLVVAADEGVMPQGREHLAICSLIGVRAGAVVLTKTDLADAEMLELAREDVAALVRGSFLQDAAVLPFSARQPEALPALRQGIAALVAQLLQQRAASSEDHRPFVLAVDRCFSLAGRGTVVTGTATSGRAVVDQFLEALPQGSTWRVRSLEQQGQGRSEVRAPGRVALNLAGAALDDVPVGTALVSPGAVLAGDRFDAVLTLLGHARPLGLRSRALLHMGTHHAEAAVVQLNGAPQAPGETALVQIQLDRPLPLPPGEAFVLRGSQVDARHGQTLGGGRLLLPLPRRHKLGDPATLAMLGQLAHGGAEAQVLALAALAGWRGVSEQDLLQQSALAPGVQQRALKQLLGAGQLRKAGQPARYLTQGDMAAVEQKILGEVRAAHRQAPTRAGIDAEALARAVGTWVDASLVLQAAQGLAKRGALVLHPPGLWAEPGFVPKATASAQLVAQVLAALRPHGLAAPTPAALASEHDLDAREVAAALGFAATQGQAVRIAEDYWLPQDSAQAAIDQVIAAFADSESFSTGQLKELLGLTRKHLIPFAEWLDAERICVRDPAGSRRIRDRAIQQWRARQV